MTFWSKWLKRKEVSQEKQIDNSQPDRELVKDWIKSINDCIVSLKSDLNTIPALTVAEFNDNFEDKSNEVIEKLNELPQKIIAPIKEVINLSKQEILTELVCISSHYSSHDSNDSVDSHKKIMEKPIQEISKELTGKQKRLLALLLDSGYLSYSEIGEKLGITHESAKNFVNRLLRDEEKARLLSKQETDAGMKVGVSDEIQDEILKKVSNYSE
jgi:hypothetical protein